MATTTNYGWTTPDDTALVKDGASAIRTLGSSVDTTTKALNPSTTLGDIEYRSSTANTNTRLGIGSTGNILTVSGGVPSWAAPAGGSLTLSTITSGTMPSATSLSMTGLTQDYFMLRLTGLKWGVGQPDSITLRLNSNSGANYTFTGWQSNADTFDYERLVATSRFKLNLGGAASNDGSNSYMIEIKNGKAAGFHTITVVSNFVFNNTSAVMGYTMMGSFEDATAITSIQVLNDSGYTFTAGTYKLIGG